MSNGMIKLYHFYIQDRSDRVRWLLEEMKVPYENVLINKDKGELQSQDYLKINPMGRVPTLVDGDVRIFESGAICLYLADKYSYGTLAPKIEDAHVRAKYLQWMVWSVASLECVAVRMFTHTRTESETKETYAFVEEQCRILAKPLVLQLKNHDYILESGFSAADIMLGTVLPGAQSFLADKHVEIRNYLERLKKRPSAISAQVFE